MKTALVLVSLMFFTLLQGAPVVSNLTAAQRTDASRMVDIYYDVLNEFPMTVTLDVSAYNGTIWGFPCTLVSGDVGPNISPGIGKHIVWDVLTEHPNMNGDQFKFKVIADDGMAPPIPADFVLVEGGTFNLAPTYTVTLSSYYICSHEVTQSEYLAVMGVNPSYFPGVSNGPVEKVSWYDAIEYCNRRSMSEALTPCYSYGSYGTNPGNWPAGWNVYDNNNLNISCNWSANGYRLPTEAQWQYAARGGNLTHNYLYSGSNNIEIVAWYYYNSSSTSHAVTTKAANELGLFDMSGNVYEKVWDVYGDYPTGSQTDPTGPVGVNPCNRVVRGGSWASPNTGCPVDLRSQTGTVFKYQTLGFRLCRKMP